MANIRCPRCGQVVDENEIKCPRCKHPIAFDPETGFSIKTPKRMKGSSIILILLLICIAIAVGIAIYHSISGRYF